jgi:predicted phage terminase large subunit-like protein
VIIILLSFILAMASIEMPEVKALGRPSRRAIAAQELISRRAARSSVCAYSSFTLPRWQDNWHLTALGEQLDKISTGDIDRLMVFMPPRQGKSELCSVRFPAKYLAAHRQNQVIHSSYAFDLSRSFSRSCRNTMMGPQHQRLWPCELSRESDGAWQLAGKENDRASFIASGVGKGISGQGANLFIIDDPVKDAEEAESEVIREKVWDWYRAVARTRLQPQAAVLLVMTRWHEDDLAGRLLLQAKSDPSADQWYVLVLPATNEDGQDAKLWHTQKGTIKKFPKYKALWPENYPPEELARIKATVGPRVWSALHLQRPSSKAGHIIKKHWIRHYAAAPNLQTVDSLLQSWDMSFVDTKDSSFVVGQVWAKRKADKYLIDEFRERMGFEETCKAVRAMCEKWPRASTKLVENKANGPAVIDTLNRTIGGFIAIDPQDFGGSKESRLSACEPDYAAGNVWYPDPERNPWVAEHEDEICAAPFGKFWDRADAASQALNWWRLKSVGKVEIQASRIVQSSSHARAYV